MVLGEFQALRAVLPLLIPMLVRWTDGNIVALRYPSSDIGRVSKIERPGVLLNVDNNKINKYHLLHPVSLQTDVFFQIQDV